MISESGDVNTPNSIDVQNTNCFPPIPPRSENSSNNSSKKGVHRDSAKYIQCTTPPSIRAPWGDIRHSTNCVGNANTRLRYGRTGTSQCSPYQLEICGDGTVGTFGTDDCDNELHEGETKNTRLGTNQPGEAKKKFLLLDLRDHFHSQEQNRIIK